MLVARRAGEKRLAVLAGTLLLLAFVQILLGALVAGIDAGRGYIDWPLMGGEWFPSEAFLLNPLWTNFFENPALVQFIHRVMGYTVFGFGLYVWWRSRASAEVNTRAAFNAVALLLSAQVALGIVTVLYAAPLSLGLAHQIGAVVLWVLIIRARTHARAPVARSIRGTR